MSKVVIAGDASGTGTFTISAPNGNTDRTLVLPDEAGTVLTSAGVPASAMPAGSVIQVVQSALTTFVSTSSSSYVTSTLTATLTPSSASNKIFVMLNGGAFDFSSSAALGSTSLYRNIGGSGDSFLTFLEQSYVGSSTWSLPHSACYLDSPSTTSSVVYTPYFKQNNGVPFIFNNGYAVPVTLTLMEIAG